MEPAYLRLLSDIFEVCIIPLMGILTAYAVAYLKAKKEEILAKIATNKTQEEKELASKYLSMVEKTVTDCVMATNQTYVDSLKQEGKFDSEAQKTAFNKTLDAVLAILTDDAKEYLTQIFGDLNVYLTNLIESQVKINKASI
jgi:H+/gluconate symporter-like permease